jgi:hypothetical protein
MASLGATRLVAVSFALFSAVAVARCDRNATTSPAAAVAGSYSSTTFVYTVGPTPYNIDSLGGGLTLTLVASGQTVSGTFLSGIPADTFDMAGTYSVSGDTVRFHQSTNTFVGAVPWLHTGNRLTYSGLYFGGPNSIDVVLTRR